MLYICMDIYIYVFRYAAYHVVVLATIGMPAWLACASFVCLVLAGRVFGLMVRLTGPLSAAAAHSAADLCIAGVLWDWFFDWV